MITSEALHFATKRITGMNQVVCDVAVRTICVASDAPVSRSCRDLSRHPDTRKQLDGGSKPVSGVM